MSAQTTGVEALGLSVRTYNILKREGIDTIEEMTSRLSTLKDLRNLGPVHFEEIVRKLIGWATA